MSESAHVETEAHEHDLHAFQAVRRMDEILVANFSVVQDLVDTGDYDLVVGDEAWDVDHFWHENPELKRTAYVWMTDFVGLAARCRRAVTHEAALTADCNAEMLEHVERFARIRDRSIFVGDPEDIVPDRFGPGLPDIRALDRGALRLRRATSPASSRPTRRSASSCASVARAHRPTAAGDRHRRRARAPAGPCSAR